MVPLTTTQGLATAEIRALVDGRDLYVWGGGPLARDVVTSLRKSGIKPKAFLTSLPDSKGVNTLGYEVVHIDALLNNGAHSFIVIASESFLQQAEEICRQSGLVKGRDFISYFSISRPAAVVEISGSCDLECVSCPQGNMKGSLSKGIMSFDHYRKVFNKLQNDLPLLCKVELFAWGEPFLNPELAKMVAYTEGSVPCSIATNLTHVENLKEVLQANPAELSITIQGHEDAYEQLMRGASWRQLQSNLAYLSALMDEVRPDTRVYIKAFEYRMGREDFRSSLRALSEKYTIDVEFCPPYPASYDLILDYAAGRAVNDDFRFCKEHLTWDLDRALALSREESAKPCLSQRVFPIINWDMSVLLCHTYCSPRIAENYLEHTWDELLSLRHSAEFCHTCQQHALHRLDLQVLSRRGPDEAGGLFIRG